MIYSRKTWTATNLIIHKITEIIDYNTLSEVTDDEVEIHLLINIKCIVILLDPVFHIRNTPHSARLVLCETNARYYKYNTEAAIYHYL